MVSVTRLVSKLDTVLCVFKWLTLCWNVFDYVSDFRHVFISVGLLVALLGPHVVLAALFTFWQWHLRLFKIGQFCLSLL